MGYVVHYIVTKKKCEDCEAGHNKPVKIIDSVYRPISVDFTGFPTKITVATESGKVAVYKFVKGNVKW